MEDIDENALDARIMRSGELARSARDVGNALLWSVLERPHVSLDFPALFMQATSALEMGREARFELADMADVATGTRALHIAFLSEFMDATTECLKKAISILQD